MENLDTNAIIAVTLISYFISLFIMYLLIKGGVQDGTKKMLNRIDVLIMMKAEEMKKNGFTDEEIRMIDPRPLNSLEQLNENLKNKVITQEQYDYYKKRLI